MMTTLEKIRRLLHHHMHEVTWLSMLLMLCVYGLISWGLMYWAGEHHIIQGTHFIYWLVTTTSTVGYGDLTPNTELGRLLVGIFIIPVGLSLFAVTVGKVAALSANHWKKGLKGMKNHKMQDHILVIGWNETSTLPLLQLLTLEARHNRGRSICLCVTREMNNPLPEDISFVSAKTFNDDEDMDRACIEQASSIIINTAQDDITLTSALYAYHRNPGAHIIAYFKDPSLSRLLEAQCPSVECTPSVEVELMVKAAMDPGSSRLHHEMLTASRGMTQYSVIYPGNRSSTKVEHIYANLKAHFNATLLAVDPDASGTPVLNPPLDMEVTGNSLLFYLAEQRIRDLDWDKLSN